MCSMKQMTLEKRICLIPKISAKFNTDQVEGIFSTRKRVPMTSATR